MALITISKVSKLSEDRINTKNNLKVQEEDSIAFSDTTLTYVKL